MIERWNEEDMKEVERQFAEYNRKLDRKEAFRNKYIRPVTDGIKFILFKPLTIIFDIIAVVGKLLGGVGCIGAVYGLYCWYKVYKEHSIGVPVTDCKDFKTAIILVIFPFAAYLVYVVFAKVSDFLKEQLPMV